jgi:hypothetical protein
MVNVFDPTPLAFNATPPTVIDVMAVEFAVMLFIAALAILANFERSSANAINNSLF